MYNDHRSPGVTTRRQHPYRQRCPMWDVGPMEPVPADGNNRHIDATSSAVGDVVRKFVLGFFFWWEMFSQFRARLGDCMDKRDGVLTGFEMGNDLVPEGLPELRPAFLMDGNIAKDGECLRFGSDEDKNGVAGFGLSHTQAVELTLGSGQRVIDWMVGDKHAYLSGACSLRAPNRLEHF